MKNAPDMDMKAVQKLVRWFTSAGTVASSSIGWQDDIQRRHTDPLQPQKRVFHRKETLLHRVVGTVSVLF
jgi:hypothetical protein